MNDNEKSLLELKLEGFSDKVRSIVMENPLVKLVEKSEREKQTDAKAS